MAQFDTDLAHGQEAEELVKSWLLARGRHKSVERVSGYQPDFDLLADNGATYEVKRDFKYARTGNFAVEVSCSDKPSGITRTVADFWVQVTDTELYIIEVKSFREWLKMFSPYLPTLVTGKNAVCYLVRPEDICGQIWCEVQKYQ